MPFLALTLALAAPAPSSCIKNDHGPRAATVTPQQQQLTTGSSRLDQIKEAGQITGSSAGIKDQYPLTFRADGSYTQTLLADNTTHNGTWMLMSNNTVLHLTDHKGDSNQYTLANLTATGLRYAFTNKNGQAEERTFSAQP